MRSRNFPRVDWLARSDGMKWRSEAEVGEEFGDVANLRAEGFGGGVFGFVMAEQVMIFLQRGAAAGSVGDDGVEIGEMEGEEILAGDVAGGLAGAGVLGQRAAAALCVRNNDVAAVGSEHANGGLVERREGDLRDATGEKRHARAARPDGGVRGAELREEKFAVDRRQQSFAAGQPEQFQNARPACQLLQTAALIEAEKYGRGGDAVWIRQQMAEDKVAGDAREKWPGIIAFDARAGVFDELAVLHAGRAGGFASAAVQTFVDVIDEAGADGHRPLSGIGEGGLLHADHLADAPARRIGLEVPEPVGGTRIEAQAAVDAAGVVLVSGDEAGNGSGGGGCHFRAAGMAALSAWMIRRQRWEFAKFWKR